MAVADMAAQGDSMRSSLTDISKRQGISLSFEDIKAHGCTPEAKIACTGKTDRCLTHNLWGALEDHIEQFLASITVQDVVDGRFPVSVEELEAAE